MSYVARGWSFKKCLEAYHCKTEIYVPLCIADLLPYETIKDNLKYITEKDFCQKITD